MPQNPTLRRQRHHGLLVAACVLCSARNSTTRAAMMANGPLLGVVAATARYPLA